MENINPKTQVYCGLRSPNGDFVLRAVGEPPKIDISRALDRNAEGKQLIFKGLIPADLFLTVPEGFHLFMEVNKTYGEMGLPVFGAIEEMKNENPYFNWGPRVPREDCGCCILAITLLYDFYTRILKVPEPAPIIVRTVMTAAPWFEETTVRKLNDRIWNLTVEDIAESMRLGLKKMAEGL
jgi:hypothetical protein